MAKQRKQLNWQGKSAEEVRHEVVDYIEMFYNGERLHSYLGYMSPNEYETLEKPLNRVSVLT